MSQSQGVYLKQQLRAVTRRYLDHFLPASPSVGLIANHPVLLSACEVSPTARGAALRKTILEVLWWVLGCYLLMKALVGEGRGWFCVFTLFCTSYRGGPSNGNVPVLFYSGSFLQFKGHAPPPRLTSLLMFLLELLRRNNDSEPALLTLPLPPLLRCVMMVNDPQGRFLLVSLSV